MKLHGSYRQLIAFTLLTMVTALGYGQKLPVDQWHYITVDDARAKWGDFDQDVTWLRYFGLDATDINRDGYLDLVSGRYCYLNPGGDMTGKWHRVDFGVNVDGMLCVDVDGDQYADVIAQQLPDVIWLEAEDVEGKSWSARKFGTLPKTGHVNGQGYLVADLVKGGKPEIILSADGGLFAASIPANPRDEQLQFIHIIKSASDEGTAAADMDGDGDLDLAYGDALSGSGSHEEGLTQLSWYENPGTLSAQLAWQRHLIGETDHAIDRIRLADLNGDHRIDMVIAEERYPGLEPDSHLFWFEAPEDPTSADWPRHEVVKQYSMNNLDAADVDRDGDIDVVTNEHKGQEHKTQLFVNDGHGQFSEQVIDTGKEMHLGAQLFDLDNDGDLDLVGHAWDNHKFLHAWRNDAVKRAQP